MPTKDEVFLEGEPTFVADEHLRTQSIIRCRQHRGFQTQHRTDLAGDVAEDGTVAQSHRAIQVGRKIPVTNAEARIDSEVLEMSHHGLRVAVESPTVWTFDTAEGVGHCIDVW